MVLEGVEPFGLNDCTNEGLSMEIAVSVLMNITEYWREYINENLFM